MGEFVTLAFERVVQDRRALAVGAQGVLRKQRGDRIKSERLFASKGVVEIEADPAALGKRVAVEQMYGRA